MKEISRQPDILTVYFGADEGSAYKINTVVDTLNAIRELYGCFSLLCYGKEPDKHQSTVCFKTGSLEIIYGFLIAVVTTGVCVPIIRPTFTELGERLRDRLFGETPSQIIQKWFENTSESNIELLKELTDLNRNLKDLNQTVSQIMDVLQKTVENTNACYKRWSGEPCIRNVRINNGNPNLEEPNQNTSAYFIENDEFQRRISSGEYRDFMQNGTFITARIKVLKRGRQTERFVSNIFEMKCGEKVIHPEPRPSDFPLLR